MEPEQEHLVTVANAGTAVTDGINFILSVTYPLAMSLLSSSHPYLFYQDY